jgi:hypothetical protein
MAPRHYHYYRGSPNYAVLNLLIGSLVVMCLWNIWVAPATDEVEIMPTTSTAFGNPTSLQQQYVSIYDGASQKHVLPIQVVDGHPAVFISPQMLARSSKFDSPIMLSLPNPNENDLNSYQNQGVAVATESNARPILQPRRIQSNNNIKDKKLHAKQKPRLHTTAKSPPRSKFSKNGSSGSNRAPQRSIFFLLALSGSALTGGVFAKRALEKLQKWEEQSNEDSLAYDMAYTDTVSEIGYGSFVTSWSNDLDKFDV